MKMKKMVSLILAGCMLFTTPVMAEEVEEVGTSNIEISSESYLETIELEMQTPISLDAEQVDELRADENIQVCSTSSEETEPNDTFDTAYPYNQLPIVNSELTGKYDLFGLGMRHAGLESAEDEDWYTISLTAGKEYFVDLRNIGKTNWFIELYYLYSDGTGYYYSTDPSINSVFEKWQEKYFYFTAEDTGTYYIRICNGGDWSDTLDYFFYVGPSIQTFDIVDMSTYGSVQIYGSSYRTYSLDLLGTAVPEYTEIVNLSIADSFPQGNVCNEVKKYMSTGADTYYCTSSGSVSGIAGEPLGALWLIGAKCENANHFTYWSARLNGRFKCIMAPYPGNELSF